MNYLSEFPAELHWEIYKYLSTKDLGRLACVHRIFYTKVTTFILYYEKPCQLSVYDRIKKGSRDYPDDKVRINAHKTRDYLHGDYKMRIYDEAGTFYSLEAGKMYRGERVGFWRKRYVDPNYEARGFIEEYIPYHEGKKHGNSVKR